MNRLRGKRSWSRGRSKKTSKKSKVRPRSPSPDDSSFSKRALNHKEVLLHAAKIGNEDTILRLFEKGLCLTEVDDQGNTALHLAALNSHQSVCRMLIVLTAPAEIWKLKNKKGQTALDLAGNKAVQEDLRTFFNQPEKVVPDDIHTKVNDRILRDRGQWSGDERLLVSVDGGGVRGLITLQVMLHIEHMLNNPLMSYIDWMAGTSVGGLISILLSTGRTVQETRRIVVKKRLQVFCGNKEHRVPKHHSSGIESVCSELLGDRTMGSIRRPKLMVTTSDSRKSPPSMILFRSYEPDVPQSIKERYNYINPDHINCRKAARCTSAAPYFFESVNGFSDGGITANNPTLALMTDFFRYYKILDAHGENSDDEPRPKIGCVLSIGTGANPVERTEGIDIKVSNKKNPWHLARSMISAVSTARNTFEMLVKEVTASNGHPVRYSREWCHSLGVPFFRFSPQLLMSVGLDQTDATDLVDMLWETEKFLRGDGRHDLEQLVNYLKTKPSQEMSEKTENATSTPIPTDVNTSSKSRRSSANSNSEYENTE